MTATVERTAARAAVENWLSEFGDALEEGDAQRAAGMFVEDSFWRDLIAFTWNLRTLEGREQIADMLTATLGDVRPANWTITEGEEP